MYQTIGPPHITNLAKNFSDYEIELLAHFKLVQVSLDSDESEQMKTIRKAVNVDKVFRTIERIREAGKNHQEAGTPAIGMSIGVYDPSVWSLDRFVERLIGIGVRSITFWDLVEKSHQKHVKPLTQLSDKEEKRAREIIRKVHNRLDYAGIHYVFAGDFHNILPKRNYSKMYRRVGKVRRLLRKALSQIRGYY